MKIEIDNHAGFCFGVQHAIELAEHHLKQTEQLYCLGEMVHNPEEVDRLTRLGMETIDTTDLSALKNAKVLIRAHGEPKETYALAKRNNIRLVEGTCPVVLKLQERVHKSWLEVQPIGGRVVLCGKKNHPELIGLMGQTNNEAIVVSKLEDLDRIDYSKPIRLFAQTTLDENLYREIADEINLRINRSNDTADFKYTNSICGQVSKRVPVLRKFCQRNDVVVFVSGKNSSNGKALFDVCKKHNRHSYFVSSPEEINQQWFDQTDRVGITGATSTPVWLMDKIATKIKEG